MTRVIVRSCRPDARHPPNSLRADTARHVWMGFDAACSAAPAADPGKAFRTAFKAIKPGEKAEDVEKAIADAQTAGLPEKYVKMLEAAATDEGFKVGSGS